MKVQVINNTDRNYNTSFGNLRGIVCHGKFSKSNPKHALAINEVLTSDAFKKFGEKYDYVAHFTRSLIPSYYDGTYYELSLAPAKEMTFIDKLKTFFNRDKEQIFEEKDKFAKRLPDLPVSFTAASSYLNLDTEAYSFFINRIKEISLNDLESDLEKALPKSYKERDAAKQGFENIENSEIPINQNIF